MRVFTTNLVANLFALFDYFKRDFELIRHFNVVFLLSSQADVLLIPIPLKMRIVMRNAPISSLTGIFSEFSSRFGTLKKISKCGKK